MTRVRWYLPPLLLAAAPLMAVIGANLGTVPLRNWVIARALLSAAAAVALILLALRVVQRDFAARAAWLSWFLICFNLYGASARGLRAFSLQIHAPDPLFAVPYVLTSAVIAAVASRPWDVRPRDPVPMTVAAALFALVGLVPAASVETRQVADRWTTGAAALIESTLSTQAVTAALPARDIYYVVLDSLGSQQTLRRSYELDLAPFVNALRAKGFYVADHARSNYAQTYLSLASTLNMTYLDDLARQTGRLATTRDPLGYLIEENALMRMASRSGYRTVAIGSDYVATQRFPRADVCVCSLSGLDEIETAAMGLTPLAAMPLDFSSTLDPFDAHRRKILDAFAALTVYGGGSRPSFVFAHILAPHPPFVFTRDGAPVRPPEAQFTLGESDGALDSGAGQADAYAQQSEYVLTRMLEIVDTLLRRPGPPPAIVIHADHGPGRGILHGTSNFDIGVRERMEIFAAYYFPEGADGLYPAMTPVNGSRVLARRYLGADLAPLPDRVMFSPLERPYDFVPVP